MNRKALKDSAKEVLKKNYWAAVGLCVLASLLSGATGVTNMIRDIVSSADPSIGELIFPLVLTMFAINPLTVGINRCLIKRSRGEETSLEDLIYAFKNNYFNVVKNMFLMALFIFLWSLLLVVPGIIKGIEYSMIPYLLAEDSGIEDPFVRTKKMMDCYKADYFILQLSFILWILLGAITLGIATVFYVAPYMTLTYIQFYIMRKKEA